MVSFPSDFHVDKHLLDSVVAVFFFQNFMWPKVLCGQNFSEFSSQSDQGARYGGVRKMDFPPSFFDHFSLSFVH
jgi:hypothetical protein